MPDVPDRAGEEDRLTVVLASLADHLDVPDTGGSSWDPAGHVRHRPRRPSIRTVPVVSAVAATLVLVVAVGALAAVGPARDAVANLLGVGATTVSTDQRADPRGLPHLADGVEPMSTAAAATTLGRALPRIAALGPPDLVAQPPEGGVLLVWEDAATTLWLRRAGSPRGELDKRVTGDGAVSFPAGLGDDALLVTGEHLLITPGRRLAAGTVVLWIDGDVELRLESDLDPDELLAIARSL